MTTKRKTLIALGVAALLVACAVGVAAILSAGASRTPQPPTTQAPTAEPPATPTLSADPYALQAYYLAWADREDYGGIYYDEDGVLVVNIAGDVSGLAPEPGVRYQEVTYPLERLEAVKDFLADYMAEYSIMMLDADEVTNLVDIGLKSYTQENMDQIRALVHDHYPDIDTDCLHFEDYSDLTISFTAGQEPATP